MRAKYSGFTAKQVMDAATDYLNADSPEDEYVLSARVGTGANARTLFGWRTRIEPAGTNDLPLSDAYFQRASDFLISIGWLGETTRQSQAARLSN